MILQQDLDAVHTSLAPLWPRLDGARIFMTGGTGFIGRWMLEALARADADVDVVVLSRDPDAFAARAPHLAARFTLLHGDVLGFDPPPGRFTHVIHAATDASAALNAQDPRRMFDTIVTGTRRALDLAQDRGAGRFLFLSSGAVYGIQPPEISHVGEDWHGGPDPLDPRSAYGEGKRAAEMLCAIYGKQFGLDVVGARIFALLGPLLSLDIHFAAGNFIRDAMAGRTIRIESAGQAQRSYLYIADLTVWLWTLLIAGAPGTTYNMGSEEAVSIADLARRTAALLGAPDVEVLGRPDPGWNPGRYVPSTARIRQDLGLSLTVDLDQAIRRTALHNGWNP
ncbi:NAD-dependent epimerase/dehydratase family protein [Altererythrobacter xixiisoli]|uniref:NAD-dependent epimerase/dehydratase family protein n=1 Tax=Croceibacterium xixiisoli TaxID=1476466 RepID=A0A6I4TQU4_9SPHN|nr:NAD-dependent epimerase/dehydratase family protein [Croceibacterium xixiisoli]MXO98555.1 NAD-dependent epimerase/dehydratase family protein [Croceibacterium xixiisoli]